MAAVSAAKRRNRKTDAAQHLARRGVRMKRRDERADGEAGEKLPRFSVCRIPLGFTRVFTCVFTPDLLLQLDTPVFNYTRVTHAAPYVASRAKRLLIYYISRDSRSESARLLTAARLCRKFEAAFKTGFAIVQTFRRARGEILRETCS